MLFRKPTMGEVFAVLGYAVVFALFIIGAYLTYPSVVR